MMGQASSGSHNALHNTAEQMRAAHCTMPFRHDGIEPPALRGTSEPRRQPALFDSRVKPEPDRLSASASAANRAAAE